MDADTIFETERLLLRPFREEDLSAVFERTSDPEVMRFHNCGIMSIEATRAGLEVTMGKAVDLLLFGARAVVVKATNQNVGFCSLGPLPRLEGNPIEIAFDIVRSCWGNGYATEAAARLVRHGFDDLRLNEIVAAVNPRNVASARVVQKLGFTVREQVPWPEQGLVDLYVVEEGAFQNWC
ncbi:MAG: GNAT family N-acetyltransferase [bacterium]|nr:GNAT family N-acetyltransferase [bacterium]